MFFPPRKGSGKMARGFRSTSESSPGAWPVEEPSKFQMGLCGKGGRDGGREGGRIVSVCLWRWSLERKVR